MIKNFTKTVSGFALAAVLTPASAAYIVTSASCPGGAGCDSSFVDTYGFEFKIETTGAADIFQATLLNTSPNSVPLALIDLLAFNMNPELILGTDFSITNVSPNWTFTQPDANSPIQFSYVGDNSAPGDRIVPAGTLTFRFDFDVALPTNAFDLWLTSASNTCGNAIGGGNDCGQVAVSFQSLGASGDDSDLLASNWRYVPNGGGGGGSIPEPGMLFLMGAGLLGLGMARRRKSA